MSVVSLKKDWYKDGFWLASLSNGHTVKESDLYKFGEDSSWLKFKKFLKGKKDVHITNLRYCLRDQVHGITPKSKDFEFRTEDQIIKPLGFNFRATSFSEANVMTGVFKSGSAKILEAYYQEFKHCLYIDVNNSRTITVLERFDGDVNDQEIF